MKTHKFWTLSVLGFFLSFVALNFLIWEKYTKELLIDGPRSGDYTRIGYIAGSSYPSKPGYGLQRKHLENYQYQHEPIDILTIGDSFSNSNGKTDQYYQDWIATIHSKTVLNVQKLPGKHFFDTLVILANSGYLDQVHPKAIILEIIEHHAADFLSKPVDMDQHLPLGDILKTYQKLKYTNRPPEISFLNIGNLKFLLYHFLYMIKDDAFFSKVYTRELSRPFFTVKNGRKLIFAYEDIEHLAGESETSIQKANRNLNALAEKLNQKGIRLYFMPVVDKYNLYSDFILHNPYPHSHFFETLRTLKKSYTFIDTKEILLAELARGEKDIYYADDSHWSSKAPQKIFRTVMLKPLDPSS
ncbi:MAG: hypothetical protein EXS63_01060 [Candidatus Omnitrophica bacterium]|nr:hypothetical protein [Candidatus Omnitrophota bacterium]